MKRTFKDAVEHRRSYYSISNKASVSDAEIEDIIAFAVKNIPSAFNSQSTRIVLLLGDNHVKLWDIVKNALKIIMPTAVFPTSEAKIDGCFASGYGTVLFFEDDSVVKSLQDSFPLYKSNFPVWSEHTSAMHQFGIWTMLEDVGMGASLQHYNPLIDAEVRKVWNLPDTWRLISQMPFGVPVTELAPKEFKPLSDRIKVFK